MPHVPDRSDWPLILLLFTAGLLAAWQFAKISLLLPVVAIRYGSSPADVAWLVSIVGLVGIVLGAVAGNVVASLGARRVLLFALWLGAALSAIQMVWLPIPLLALTRVLEGMSHTLIVVAAPTLIAGAASESGRPVAMGLWAMFFGVAFALGAVVFPPLVARFGLDGLFLAHAVGLAWIAMIIGPLLAPQPRQRILFAPLDLHRRIYIAPNRAMPGLCFVFYTVLFVALVTLLPVALDRPGLAVSLPLLSLLGTFGAGWLSKRFPPQSVIAAGFVCTAGFAAAGWFGGTWPIFGLFTTMGLVPGACFALIPHLNRTVADQALSTGGIAQMGNVGTTLGTPIFAAALGVGGPPTLWLGTMVIAFGGLGTLWALSRKAANYGTERTRVH